jgi:hypothetical protein
MTIHLVLGGNHSFDPDEVAILVKAYEDALHKLRLANRDDAATRTIAGRIVELAKLGERDAERLCNAAVASFRK